MDVDAKVIERAVNGDDDAFQTIVEAYQGFVFTVILNITGNYQEAENLAQETFIQVYHSLRSYEFKGFKTWLGRIATNKAIDWKRKQKGSRLEKVIYLEDINELGHGLPHFMDEYLIEKEDQRKVKGIWKLLPDKYRVILDKYFIQCKDYRQIAQEESISCKTVESRLYRAKKLIKKKWGEDEFI